MIGKFWSADGGEEFQRDMDVSSELLRKAVEGWLGRSANARPQSVGEMWGNQLRMTELGTRWVETKEVTRTGRSADGLIMPSTTFPAIRHAA